MLLLAQNGRTPSTGASPGGDPSAAHSPTEGLGELRGRVKRLVSEHSAGKEPANRKLFSSQPRRRAKAALSLSPRGAPGLCVAYTLALEISATLWNTGCGPGKWSKCMPSSRF